MIIVRLLILSLAALAFCASARAQQSGEGYYFGRIGNTDFLVSTGSDGTSVRFEYFSSGSEEGNGTVGANSSATFSTNRNRQVTVRVQGNTITGTFLGQAFSATREGAAGGQSGISGSYFGSLYELRNGTASPYTIPALFQVFPSGKVLMRAVTPESSPAYYFGVGTLTAGGSIALALSSSYTPANGDTLRTTFKPEGDVALGEMSSGFFPRNSYVYVLARMKESTLINVSTRGTITPNQAMTAGFVITGGSKTVLVRVIGPTLGAFGVGGANSDPRVTLYAGQAVVGSNDNWGDNANASDITTLTAQAGGFSLGAGSRDAALLLHLRPGAYTAQASSTGSASGEALIEVYEITK